MNVWTIAIFVVFLGVVGYLLRDFFIAKEGFQVPSWSSNSLFTTQLNDDSIMSCVVNNDGTFIVYVNSNTVIVKLLRSSWITVAMIQNTDTTPIRNIDMSKFPDDNGLYSIAINTDNQSIIYKGSINTGWSLFKTIVIDKPISCFDSQGNTIIIGSRYANSDNGLVKIVDLRTSMELNRRGDYGNLFGASVAINSDASIVAIGSFDNSQQNGNVVLYQLVKSKEKGFIIGMNELIEGNSINDAFGKSLSFDDSGKILAIGAEGYVKKYSISATSSTFNVSLIATITSPLDRFGNFVKLSSTGDKLIVSSYQNNILVYNNNNQQVSSISTNSTIFDIDATASGNTIVAYEHAGINGVVNVYTQMLAPAPSVQPPAPAPSVRGPVPSVVPEPIQGQCPAGMFQYGMYAGGFCCPVKPTGYRSEFGDYETCPTTTVNNKSLCALDPKQTQGYPVCPVPARIQQLNIEDVQFRQTAGAPALAANLEDKRDLFHYGYSNSNSIPVDSAMLTGNPDLPAQLDAALGTPGDTVKASQRIVEVGRPGRSLQDDLDVCRQYTKPEDIPANSGCGWYHVPDISGANPVFRTSYCVPGGETGPNRGLTGLPTDGRWIWNKEVAIAAEAKKFCARGTSCKMQDTNESCAFCVDKGHSIPYNRLTGQPLYGETCGQIIANPASCPADPTVDLCSTSTDAAYKKNCFLTLLKNQGVNQAGLLYKYVDGKLSDNEKARFTALLSVLNTRTRWRSDMLEASNLTISSITLDMAGLTRKVKKVVAAKGSYDAIVVGIARHFVDGTPFDSSAHYYQTAQQSSDTQLNAAQHAVALGDLQQEFRKAGCQAAGADYPQTLPTTGSSLADHRMGFQKLYLDMFNEQDEKQQNAIRRCLNASFSVAAATATKGSFCNEPGIEYLIFSPMTGPLATLIARLISPVGLLGSTSSYAEAERLRTIMADAPLSDQPEVGYLARTMFSLEPSMAPSMAPSANQLTASWSLPPNGTYTFRVNNQIVPGTRASGSSAPNISYTANQPTLLEVQYLLNSNDKTQRKAWGNPQYSYIFQNLRKFRLIQESYKPFVGFDFAVGSQDLNRLATLQPLRAEFPIQFTPRFTGAPTGAPSPNIDASYGLMSPAVLTPRLRSSLVQIVDITVYMTDAGTVFKLVGDDSYFEQLRVSSTGLTYTVFNGSEKAEYFAAFPTGFNPYGKSQRYVLVFGKSGTNLSVQFIYDNAGLKTLASLPAQTIRGTLGFQRSLQVVLLDQGFKGALQKFRVFDRKTVRMGQPEGEGFQNQSDIPTILQEKAIEDRIQPEQAQTIDRSTYVPGTILGTAPTARVGGPVSSGGSCTFPVRPLGDKGGFRYSEGYFYNEVFRDKTELDSNKQDSLKACYDACAARPGCVGMNYASDTGTCTYYATINSADKDDKPNSVSIIMPGQDKSLTDMRNKVRTAIKSYQAMKDVLKESQQFRDATRYTGRTTITDQIVAGDLAAIETMQNIDCLNAFLEKYTLNTK